VSSSRRPPADQSSYCASARCSSASGSARASDYRCHCARPLRLVFRQEVEQRNRSAAAGFFARQFV